MRENLDGTIIVVAFTNQVGEEVEVAEIDANTGRGSLTTDASQAIAIGEAVRKALLQVGDGEAVEVRAFFR